MERILKTLAPIALALTTLTLTGCPTPKAPDAGTKSHGPSPVEFKIISPTTGEVSGGTITAAPGTPERTDQLRAAMGMPSQAEADKATHYLTEAELAKAPVSECAYIGTYNTFAYLDVERKMWTGTKYHGGRYPILARMGDVVQTVVKDARTPEGKYTIVYMSANRMVPEFARSEWAAEGNPDGREFPTICDKLEHGAKRSAPTPPAPRPAKEANPVLKI